jgi:hypothetical protein
MPRMPLAVARSTVPALAEWKVGTKPTQFPASNRRARDAEAALVRSDHSEQLPLHAMICSNYEGWNAS